MPPPGALCRTVTDVICLQGGAEFGPACREMDADLLRRAGPGPTVIVALAGAPGRDYDTAAANGVRHFASLGAEARAAPDARDDPAGALAAVQEARLVVLPGGSPHRLLAALLSTKLADALRAHVAAGGALMGASAGAMVLCEHTVLPAGRPKVSAALGLVPGCLVLPHYDGQPRWVGVLPPGAVVLGLPECAGLLIENGRATAVGAAPSMVGGRLVEVGESVVMP